MVKLDEDGEKEMGENKLTRPWCIIPAITRSVVEMSLNLASDVGRTKWLNNSNGYSSGFFDQSVDEDVIF